MMLLSEAIDRITGIAMERIPDRDRRDQLQFVRGIMHGAISSFGDLELNVEIRRIPAHEQETVHAEAKEA